MTANIDVRVAAITAKYCELPHGRVAYRTSGSGFPVVLLHGIGSGSASWLLQFESLAKHYQVIAWDAPGYGDSNALPNDRPSVWEYVEVLRNWLGVLNIDRYHLVAHSLGALIAGTHCQPDIALPESVTFIDPTLGYGALPLAVRNEKTRRRLQTFAQLGASGLATVRAPALLSANTTEEALAIVRWNMSRLQDRGYRQAIYLLGNTDLLAEIGQIAVPILVICGSADQITPQPLSQRLADAYTSATCMLIDGCGHAAYIEASSIVNEALIRHFAAASSVGVDLP